MQTEAAPPASNLQKAAERGIALCRLGEWEKGLLYLARVAEVDRQGADLPSLFYSYLGYGIARYEKRIPEGLGLCKHAIKQSFYEPDNFLNLGRTYLLAGNRRLAYQSLVRGLSIEPRHPGLRHLHAQLGRRRRPVLGFLPRTNPLNLWLGQIRHKMRTKRARR